MPSDVTPRTEAGKILLNVPAMQPFPNEARDAILAIEAEARASHVTTCEQNERRDAKVTREAVEAERERLLALFDLAWRHEVSDVNPDGIDAAIGYALARVRKALSPESDSPEPPTGDEVAG
jgi:hypothetical protein